MKFHKCNECDLRAQFLILVPWIHVTTREKGAAWTPFCTRHEFNYREEDWEKVELSPIKTSVKFFDSKEAFLSRVDKMFKASRIGKTLN